MIINSLILDPILEDTLSKTDRQKVMVYPISPNIINHVMSKTLPGSTAFLFSGSWRLNIDAVYLELRHFRNSDLCWHPRTLFVEPQDPILYHYTLTKLKCNNLIVLHSDYWCGHRPLENIVADLDFLHQFSDRVICSVPIKHTNFNKLIMSVEDLCQRYPGTSVYDDSIIMVR